MVQHICFNKLKVSIFIVQKKKKKMYFGNSCSSKQVLSTSTTSLANQTKSFNQTESKILLKAPETTETFSNIKDSCDRRIHENNTMWKLKPLRIRTLNSSLLVQTSVREKRLQQVPSNIRREYFQANRIPEIRKSEQQKHLPKNKLARAKHGGQQREDNTRIAWRRPGTGKRKIRVQDVQNGQEKRRATDLKRLHNHEPSESCPLPSFL